MSKDQHFSNPDYHFHHPYPPSPIQSNSSKSLHGSPTPVPNNSPKSPHGSSYKCNPSNVTKSSSALHEVIIGKKSGMSMMIPLRLDGTELEALVDSGAQVTVISHEMYKSLKNPPKITEKVVLKTATKDTGFEGYVPRATLTFGELKLFL